MPVAPIHEDRPTAPPVGEIRRTRKIASVLAIPQAQVTKCLRHEQLGRGTLLPHSAHERRSESIRFELAAVVGNGLPPTRLMTSYLDVNLDRPYQARQTVGST